MTNLNEFLESKGISPDDIAEGTGLSKDMITGISCGEINIMDVDLGIVLLLCRFLELPLSEFAGYCVMQADGLKITMENGYYFVSFEIGGRQFKEQMISVNSQSAKYIEPIALLHYESFLDDIVRNEKIRIIEYKKLVEREMRRLHATDLSIRMIDDELLESLLDAGHSPKDAAKELIPKEED